MTKNKIIQVQGQSITITQIHDFDFISLTDMAKEFGGNDQIKNWIRTRRTVEFLGTWESIYNKNFNMVEFHHVMYDSGSEKFIMSPQQWVYRTSAIGLTSKSGRYGGGTFAHKDIAFEFGSWLSPQFKIYLIKEYQRLKEIESNQYNLEWNVKRILSKANYQLHTDAIKNHILPKSNFSKQSEWAVYADEADLLNIALFGCTAKIWREANHKASLEGKNIRDMASINELTILSNLESLNSLLIKQEIEKTERFKILHETAKDQLKSLNDIDFIKSVKLISNKTVIDLKVNENKNKIE